MGLFKRNNTPPPPPPPPIPTEVAAKDYPKRAIVLDCTSEMRQHSGWHRMLSEALLEPRDQFGYLPGPGLFPLRLLREFDSGEGSFDVNKFGEALTEAFSAGDEVDVLLAERAALNYLPMAMIDFEEHVGRYVRSVFTVRTIDSAGNIEVAYPAARSTFFGGNSDIKGEVLTEPDTVIAEGEDGLDQIAAMFDIDLDAEVARLAEDRPCDTVEDDPRDRFETGMSEAALQRAERQQMGLTAT